MFTIYTQYLYLKKLRDKFLTFLKESNIFGQIHYPPINKMTGLKNLIMKTKYQKMFRQG